MARKTINVCDIDESDSGVRTYEVKDMETGEKRKADLCSKHRELLDMIVAGTFPGAGERPSATRGRRGGNRVTSMADIEAQRGAQAV